MPKAFDSLKQYLTSPPVLSRPLPGEPLYMYLAVAETTISSCLLREEDGKQMFIYYISHVLRDAETRYPLIEKMAYSLLLASKRLRPYFQGHDIHVYTKFPLRKILHKPALSGHLVNWVVELSQFNITYLPRVSIKGQALADFMVEDYGVKVTEINYIPTVPTEAECYQAHGFSTPLNLFVDGSSTTDGCGARVLLMSPEGFEIKQSIQFSFPATNNCLEYEALLRGLRLAKALQVQHLKAFSDSQLVVNQVLGTFCTKSLLLVRYVEEVKAKMVVFQKATLEGILRETMVKFILWLD